MVPALLLFVATVLSPSPSPSMTLRELAKAPDLPAGPIREHRHELKTAPSWTRAIASAVPRAEATVAAPPLGTNFFTATSSVLFPADAAGAVGPNHVVTASNAGIVVHDRSGKALVSASLSQFWFDPSVSGGLYYDPRIVYDKAADRFVFVALYDRNLSNPTLLIGATQTGDPTGAWARYRLGVDLEDFTRLGMTSDKILICAQSGQGDLFVVPKTDLYASTLKSVNHISTLPDIHPVTFVDNSSPTAYFMEIDLNGTLYLSSLGSNGVAQVRTVRSEAFQYPFPSEIAPQLGGARMDVGEPSVQAVVGRGGVLWAVHLIIPSTGPKRSSIRWWRVPLDGGAAATGTIDDPTGANFYAFPSIAVNRYGAALISYSLFSNDRYPTAAYSFRDSSGTMSETGILKEGELQPRQTRWGDYTTTVVDPVNDTDFWSVQPYGVNADWAMWWGQIKAPIPAPPRVRAVKH